MGRVYVAYFEAGTLARQAARAKSRNTALVRNLRQRVGLVHKLGQLAGAEELLDRCRNGLGVDQVVRHQVVAFGLIQSLLDGALDAHQASAKLVLGEFAHRAYATIAEVIDIIDFAAAIAQLDQDAHHIDDVFVRQGTGTLDFITPDAAVELHATHCGKVVALVGIEQAMEQIFHGIFRRRLAGTHHAVDRHARSPLVGGLVDAQGR